MRHLLIIFSLIFLFTSQFSFGQKSRQKDAVNAVNELLTEGVRLNVKGKKIVLTIDNELGKSRKDVVLRIDLDPESIAYDHENSMIIVNCYNGECVQRLLYKQKIKRYYERLSIPVILEERNVQQALSRFEDIISQ